jgi:hypothetical protein
MVDSKFKGTDSDGRIRLGSKFANKQWQFSELKNGAIVLVPMVVSTNEKANSLFKKTQKKT